MAGLDGPGAVLARGNLGHMKELRDFLAGRGIEADLRQPPQGQGSG